MEIGINPFHDMRRIKKSDLDDDDSGRALELQDWLSELRRFEEESRKVTITVK